MRTRLLALALLAFPTSALAQQEPNDEVEAILASMSTEEKIGQVLLVGISGKQVVDSSDAAYLIRQMRVGGIILLGRNVESPRQLARLNRDLQELAPRVPLFIALDQEGGTVARLHKDATVLPGNMALGATRSRSLAYMAGRVTGAELHATGVNMNLAPVLDVNSNPDNPVIGVRSYGDSARLVAELGSWYIRGLQEMGVVAVAKHFPGHGETEEDSHRSMPAVPHDKKTIEEIDVPPFRLAMRRAGLDAVMTAHVRYPAFDGAEGPPATMSRALLKELLRDELHFDGLVLTDDLEMAAIADTVGIGQGAVNALEAGADLVMIIWHRSSKDTAHAAIKAALDDGSLPMERLDEAVRRVLTIKQRRGILDAPPPDPEKVDLIVGHPHHRRIAAEIARRAVTVVQDEHKLLPVEQHTEAGVMLIGRREEFVDQVKSIYRNTYVLAVGRKPDARARAYVVRTAKHYESRVGAYVVMVQDERHAELAETLAKETDKPVIAVALGSPYFLDGDEVDAYVCAWSHRPESQRAAARTIFGRGTAPGVSPVKFGVASHAASVARRRAVRKPSPPSEE